MPARIFRFKGKAYAASGTVSVTATMGGTEIYSGSVPTTNEPTPSRNISDLDTLFEYTGSTDTTGNVSVTLTVSGGDLFFGEPQANYSGAEFTVDWTDPQNPVLTVITQPVDYYSDVNWNTLESDGKNNVTVNGASANRVLISDSEIGDWQYLTPNGGTLSCSLFIDPAKVKLNVPPPTFPFD